jgi:hypothetical protein
MCDLCSDTFRLDHRGNSLFVTASGVHGIAECTTLLWRMYYGQEGLGAAVILCDLRGALITLDKAEYLELLNEAIKCPITVPIGFVGGEWLVTLGAAHRNLMGRRGHERAFFATVSEAALWCGGHSALASRARPRSEPAATPAPTKPRRPLPASNKRPHGRAQPALRLVWSAAQRGA